MWGKNKHDWVEIYLPDSGWVPVDPTWGQQLEGDKKYFAAMTPDHIILTRGQYLSMLEGYHYWYYKYWYDGTLPEITAEETWSILKVP